MASKIVTEVGQDPSFEEMFSKINLTGRYMLVDIGANLTNKKYSRDLDGVVQRAKDSGVAKIMVTGTSVQGSKDALRLTRLYPGTLYSTAGLHPHDAKSWMENDENGQGSYRQLKQLLSNPEVVAVGECGLDFNRNFSPPDVQLEVFEKQVQLAIEVNKPLFVHERDAHTELMSILDKYLDKLPPTVIHCFTGNKEQLKMYLSKDFYIGLTGFLWKDKTTDGVRSILENKMIPLNRLLLETDAPFMYPNTRAASLPELVKKSISEQSNNFHQRYCTFQRNEPCSLPVTLEIVSAFMGSKPEEVALRTTFNAVKLFGLNS